MEVINIKEALGKQQMLEVDSNYITLQPEVDMDSLFVPRDDGRPCCFPFFTEDLKFVRVLKF